MLSEGEVFLSELLEECKDRLDNLDRLDFGIVTDEDFDNMSINDPFVYVRDKGENVFFVIEQYKDIRVAENKIFED